MKLFIFSATSLLCLCSFLLTGSISRAQSAQPVFSHGRVSHAHLSDFSPAKSVAAYKLLMQKRLPEAVVLLEKEMIQHPASLAAYVGLAQARPETWAGQIEQLETANNAVAKFKLGTLLYYRWGQRRVPDDMTDLARAQKLLHQAWLECRLPVMAMMLDEVARIPSSYTQQYPAMAENIHDELIEQLAPEAYHSYQKAKASGWNSPPPPIAAIPTQNLRPLRGVIRNLWNHSGGVVGLWGVKDGLFLFIEEPREKDGEAKAKYLEAWFGMLTQAMD